MGIIRIIRNDEIKRALEGLTRQYFVGNLKKTQILKFFYSENVEIGITSYKTHSRELPHKHTNAIEYQYVISGRTQYIDLETQEIYDFKSGDFYEIPPNTAYAQKSRPGTIILFIKIPSTNDKITLPVDEEIKIWLENKIINSRTDYFYDVKAPIANSIKPAAAVAIVKEGKILMLRRRDNKKWTMPGGTLELGENLINCALREVKEETGLNIVIKDIIGTYTDPNIIIEYSDGEVRQEFTILYFGEYKEGEIQIDEESEEYKWINIKEVLNLDLAESQKRRLKDVIQYLRTKAKHIG